MSKPVFAVVGHVNKGKSSLVSTLAEDDTVAVALEARTTLECREFSLRVDGADLFTLIDTPGFEQARRALQWLKQREEDASSRPKIIRDFLKQFEPTQEFPEECKLLRPVMNGAGILYVVDGSRPFSAEYEAEMEILRWTGQPRMAIINRIGQRDYCKQWRAALDQYFSLVRVFDAHQADYSRRLQLLNAFREISEDWRPVLDEAIENMIAERARRRRQSAEIIADSIGRQLGLVLDKKIPDNGRPDRYRPDLEERYRNELRQMERKARDQVEGLYQHSRIERVETELDILTEDLFDETIWLRLGLKKTQLIGAGAFSGALVGGGIDATVGGASFALGAMIGGAMGGLSAWLKGDALSKVSIQGLRLGGRLLTIGPMRNPQFPWVVLDRALIHHKEVSERAHARRDQLALAGKENVRGRVAGLPYARRRDFESCFSRLRKVKEGEAAELVREELANLIEPMLEHER